MTLASPTMDAAALKVEARETHDSVIRLEGKVESVRSGQDELKDELQKAEDKAEERSRRTHEMLGALLKGRT